MKNTIESRELPQQPTEAEETVSELEDNWLSHIKGRGRGERIK
jgi:hypothetical protein